MEPANALDRKGESAATGSAPPGDSGLLEEVKSLWQELRGLAHDELTLAALETRLAGKSLVTMIAAGVMVAVLLVSVPSTRCSGRVGQASFQAVGLAKWSALVPLKGLCVVAEVPALPPPPLCIRYPRLFPGHAVKLWIGR